MCIATELGEGYGDSGWDSEAYNVCKLEPFDLSHDFRPLTHI